MDKEVSYYVKSSIGNSSWSLCSLCVCDLIIKSCTTLVVPWTIARQAPLSMEFPRKEYWSGLLFLSRWDLANPGIELGLLALQMDYLLTKTSVL